MRAVGHHVPVPIRVVTWNLQSRERPDLGAVIDVLRDIEPDVVLLQEVQRGRARHLAGRLGWSHEWQFKHWPLVIPAEGLAVLTPEPMAQVRRETLAMGWRFWSSRRRVALAGTVADGPLRIVNTHLGAGVGDGERRRQARITVSMLGPAGGVVAGDLNTHPGSKVLAAYANAGLRDAWAMVRPDDEGATNWRAGPRTEPPVQRLDYVLVSNAITAVGAWLPSDGDHARFGALSDHVPVVVDLSVDRG
jgi:endonuclease/exonuclease/phosphatase family metal-dependent hydrolase